MMSNDNIFTDAAEMNRKLEAIHLLAVRMDELVEEVASLRNLVFAMDDFLKQKFTQVDSGAAYILALKRRAEEMNDDKG